MSPLTIGAFVAYFLTIAAIGVVATRRTKNVTDYAIGSRNLSGPVAGLSAGASDMSGWLLLGLPGAVFVSGLQEAWILVGLIVGAWLNWRLVAPRLRRETADLDNALTLPQFFARRTRYPGSLLRVVTAGITIVFFTLYASAGFVAGAKLFEIVLGLSYERALAIGAFVIVSYTAFGGFLAVSWTDFFQALLMMGALLLLPVIGSIDVTAAGTNLHVPFMGLVGVISLLAWGLGYFGQPHILVRFMAVGSSADIPKARRIGMTWMVLSGIGAIAVGFVGSTHFVSLEDPEVVLIELASALLDPWLAGIVLAAILAAVMSTVDSQLLVASTSLVLDVGIITKHPLALSRLMVVLVAMLAWGIALDPENRVLDLVAYAWGGLGASLGPCVLYCLFWKGTTGQGLIAGMLVGGSTIFLWRNLSGGIFDLYEILPAFVLACVAIYFV
ncbi:MAG: sodium/solute symporter, partial [Pseudomonadales bacterium]